MELEFHTEEEEDLVVEKARCRSHWMKTEEADCSFNTKGKQGKTFQFCLKAARSRLPTDWCRKSQLQLCNPLIKTRLNKTSVTYSALMREGDWMLTKATLHPLQPNSQV